MSRFDGKNYDRYLGDGVYASFDGYQIWLKTQQGNVIALEEEVFSALVKYRQDLISHIEGAGT